MYDKSLFSELLEQILNVTKRTNCLKVRLKSYLQEKGYTKKWLTIRKRQKSPPPKR